MRLVIMRHGQTVANRKKVYAGWADVPLTEEGERQALAAGVVPSVDRVYVSRLSRAQRTAGICFPHAQQVQVPGLEEMDFGVFEGRGAADMEDDEQYRSWVDGGCTGVCPGGEGCEGMDRRVRAAVCEIVRQARGRGEEQVVIVAHGGTIMAAMSSFTDADVDYFSWMVGNCEGYCVQVEFSGDGFRFAEWQRFSDLSFMGEGVPDGAAKELPAHSFFSNRACAYFPCHEGVQPDEFNCLFCYCPLYALGPDCGGNFSYTEAGRKNCSACTVPHVRDNGARLVAARYEDLARLAQPKQ